MSSSYPCYSVNYFKQFVRDFIRPYGGTDYSPSDETIFKRLQPFTCELLIRPKMGVSELAQTVTETVENLSNSKSGILSQDKVDEIKRALTPLEQVLEPFNLKNGQSERATKKNLKEIIRFFLNESSANTEQLVKDIFIIGSNLLTLSTHLLVAEALFTNPESYANRVASVDKQDQLFRDQKDIKSMVEFLTVCCVQNTPHRQECQTALLSQLSDSESSSSQNSGNLASQQARASALSHSSSSTSSESSSSSSDSSSSSSCDSSDDRPLPGDVKRGKKRPCTLSSSSTSGETKKKEKQQRKRELLSGKWVLKTSRKRTLKCIRF